LVNSSLKISKKSASQTVTKNNRMRVTVILKTQSKNHPKDAAAAAAAIAK
jgi:hypothetical protein